MIKRLIFICLAVFLASCKTVLVQKEFQKTTTQNIKLGTVGEQKDFILEQDYNHTALPNYQDPIKIQVSLIAFNTSTYKTFTKAKTSQNQSVAINYIDSISNKPKFLKLEIADRVAVLNALNNTENKDVFQFLKNKNDAHIITSVSLVLKENDITAITKANEVFLENSGIKSYALHLYNNKELQQTINFKEGVVFAYQTSNACWKENDKYQLKIIDLVESNDKCPSKTYRASKRAKQKINYYKF